MDLDDLREFVEREYGIQPIDEALEMSARDQTTELGRRARLGHALDVPVRAGQVKGTLSAS